MKRYEVRLSGLLMALGLAAVLPAGADEVVATAAGGWFAVDSRAVKDTTLQGGAIVGGATNVVLQSSPDAWGEAGGGASATIAWESAAGGRGTVATATTAREVSWMPAVRSGANTLTYTSGSVQKTAQFKTTYLNTLQVGENVFATVRDDVCTITGAGTVTDTAALKAEYVTNIVIAAGVTGIGANAFDGWTSLRDVSFGADCVSIGSQAFLECFNLTNVSFAATGAAAVGDYAFYRCNSLEKMSFAAKPTFGEKSYTLQAGIYMRDGLPRIYSLPDIVIGTAGKKVLATNDLGGKWTDVTDMTDADRAAYRFFKIVVE